MGANRTVRVMLVEDHVAFREALACLLTHQSDLEVVAQAGSLVHNQATFSVTDRCS